MSILPQMYEDFSLRVEERRTSRHWGWYLDSKTNIKLRALRETI